ncbi:asparagine synthase-related protein [Halosimplex salinum]|uniref:asparagine synthase-related protein n=1 Tax=Halosimplex salinum TaxID=1710538 RepID=UPI000F4652C2|nr:asparagine synthase-related protein [Halosimplex salinum]
MSGILCLFDRGRGSLDRDVLTRALDTLDHRGPDGQDAWLDDRVGLGHQQLRTTPEGRFDDQPSRDRGLVVSADARIDNRDELLETLRIVDPPGQVPDSQLLAAAYREWGEHCVDHLVGAFAFVVWDANEQSVFCARDHFGVKPLYYHEGEGGFAAASEAKALLALPFVPGTLDDLKIGDFLLNTWEDKENTYYEAIRRLPPAHAMRIDASEARTWQYWDLDPTRTVSLESDVAYERRFRELLEQAVDCRLRTDGSVGSDLSGGLDSSAVTAVARDLLPSDEPLYTYSNVYDESPTSDEREFIETLTDRPGIVPRYVYLDGVGTLVDVDEWLPYYDEPAHNVMHFGKWQKLRRIRDDEVGVHLSGALGDSAIDYGFGWLPQMLRTGHWLRLYRTLREMSDVTGAPFPRLFKSMALANLVPDPVERTYQRLRGDPVLLEAVNPTVNPEFVDEYGLQGRYKSLQNTGSVLRRSARRWQRRSLLSGHITATFETVDQLHALFGVEPRHPFTDVRLVEFSLAMPPEQHLSDGYTRSIARRALGDLLPDKIQWRPWKAMLDEGFRNALAAEDEHVRRMLSDPGRLATYVDVDALRESYDRFDRDVTSEDPKPIWRALSLYVWLEERGERDRVASADATTPRSTVATNDDVR